MNLSLTKRKKLINNKIIFNTKYYSYELKTKNKNTDSNSCKNID